MIVAQFLFIFICPVSVYFHTLAVVNNIFVLLICRRKMSSIGSTSLGFIQNIIHDFQNTKLNT